MTDVTIEECGPAPLHLLELWGDPAAAADRITAALGHALPRSGKAQDGVLRTGPATWLIEGDAGAIDAALEDGGALTAVGGGLARVRLSGPDWRSLLMEGALFDAESQAFGPDCVATTPIDHVTVTVRVIDADACLVYVPCSHLADLLHFWRLSAGALPR